MKLLWQWWALEKVKVKKLEKQIKLFWQWWALEKVKVKTFFAVVSPFDCEKFKSVKYVKN